MISVRLELQKLNIGLLKSIGIQISIPFSQWLQLIVVTYLSLLLNFVQMHLPHVPRINFLFLISYSFSM
jgi:hypothetical protein